MLNVQNRIQLDYHVLVLNDRVQGQRKVMPLGCIAGAWDVTNREQLGQWQNPGRQIIHIFPKETDAHQWLKVMIYRVNSHQAPNIILLNSHTCFILDKTPQTPTNIWLFFNKKRYYRTEYIQMAFSHRLNDSAGIYQLQPSQQWLNMTARWTQ